MEISYKEILTSLEEEIRILEDYRTILVRLNSVEPTFERTLKCSEILNKIYELDKFKKIYMNK